MSTKESKWIKNPQAPRRFRSAYILFSQAKHADLRTELLRQESKTNQVQTTDVAKLVSQAWRNLPPDARRHWDEAAKQDKARYLYEKEKFSGPWRIATSRRQKKSPHAPKRPPSAFILYFNTKRPEIRKKYPTFDNTQTSRFIAQLWKNAPEAERSPFVEEAKRSGQKYKEAIRTWRDCDKRARDNSRQERENFAMQKALEMKHSSVARGHHDMAAPAESSRALHSQSTTTELEVFGAQASMVHQLYQSKSHPHGSQGAKAALSSKPPATIALFPPLMQIPNQMHLPQVHQTATHQHVNGISKQHLDHTLFPTATTSHTTDPNSSLAPVGRANDVASRAMRESMMQLSATAGLNGYQNTRQAQNNTEQYENDSHGYKRLTAQYPPLVHPCTSLSSTGLFQPQSQLMFPHGEAQGNSGTPLLHQKNEMKQDDSKSSLLSRHTEKQQVTATNPSVGTFLSNYEENNQQPTLPISYNGYYGAAYLEPNALVTTKDDTTIYQSLVEEDILTPRPFADVLGNKHLEDSHSESDLEASILGDHSDKEE